MIRVVLLNLLLLFLPSILYFAYAHIMRQLQPEEKPVPDAPFVWLVLIGAVMMVAGTLSFANWNMG